MTDSYQQVTRESAERALATNPHQHGGEGVMAKETFGRMDAERGERCTNPGHDDRFTTPCCYADLTDADATECPECGAPIVCEVEQQPVAVCRIAEEHER